MLSSAANRISAFRQFRILKVHNLCILRAILSLWVLRMPLPSPAQSLRLDASSSASSLHCFPLAVLFAFIIAFSMNNHQRNQQNTTESSTGSSGKVDILKYSILFSIIEFPIKVADKLPNLSVSNCRKMCLLFFLKLYLFLKCPTHRQMVCDKHEFLRHIETNVNVRGSMTARHIKIQTKFCLLGNACRQAEKQARGCEWVNRHIQIQTSTRARTLQRTRICL